VSTSGETTARSGGGSGLFWALVPVILLVASVTGLGTMASIAVRDPGFALEKNYYERAVHWDREQADRAASSRLGYRIALTVEPGAGAPELVVRIVDRQGAAIRRAFVSAEAFANARAGERRSVAFTEQADGTYRAALERPRPGLWELRLSALDGDARFTETVRIDVPAAERR
jgi:nitrogen fixation protein FixH